MIVSTMSSSLTRLLLYTKGTKSEALENFTTEAFAAAIRRDFTPLVPVLRDRGLLRYDEEPRSITAQTQVAVTGAGVIDLDLVIDGGAWAVELWIEVKVGAGESGHQLAAYQRAIDRLAHRPRLVVLSKRPLVGHAEVPWISWQAIWQTAIAHTHASPYWLDLRAFLEDIHMADAYDAPIIASEAASLQPAHGLYQKAARIVGLVTATGSERWPGLGWPKSTGDADEQLLWQFKRHGRITLPIRTKGPVAIFVGVAQREASIDDQLRLCSEYAERLASMA